VICTIFFLASRKLPFLVKNWIICGLLYGVGAYFVMYGIVLRLTFHRNFLTAFGSIIQGVLNPHVLRRPSHLVRRSSLLKIINPGLKK
jgi:hypothetical protein